MKSIKKIIIAILAASVAISVMACSGEADNASSKSSGASSNTSSVNTNESTSEKTENAESQTSSNETSEKTSSKSESSEASKENSAATSSENSKSDSKSKDVIIYKDVNIAIDDDVSTLLKKLGDYDSNETIEPENEDEETAYSYTYDNMTIYAYVKNEKQYVASVFVSAPSEAKASGGIGIGSSRDEIHKVFGETQKDDVISYEVEDSIVIFTLKDDKVTEFSLDRGFGDDV